MRPEAADYLNKAHDDLEDARKVARIGLAKIAARTAYYAAFHAAEAFFVERTGKIAKTHSGVRAAFARLAKETIDIDMYFPKFLTKAHLYKEISDYGTRSGPEITVQDEEEAITDAGRFVDCIGLLLKPNR